MATVIFKVDVSERSDQVARAVGSPVVSDPVEITVEGAAVINGSSGTRTMTKSEILMALETIKHAIHNDQTL